MGNEYSSPRRDDDETIMSGYTEDTRDQRSSSRKKRDNFQSPNFIDAICGRMVFDDDDDDAYKRKASRSGSRRSSRSYDSDDDTLDDSRDRRSKRGSRDSSSRKNSSKSLEDASVESFGNNDAKNAPSRDSMDNGSFDGSAMQDRNSSPANAPSPPNHAISKPLASAFAKRCYFTKAGIGPLTQHYEGITLTGNIVLMLASAMKLKGCPTICDEDLRRVEQTYPNQFSRLPDELLLSSGWRRISKHCHFSGKPIPDGVAFFHSKERLHPQTGGYYFLLASSLGMERPDEVEPLTIDMLILLQTDYPGTCEQAPPLLLEDPTQWTLVTRFCFFSGGPINADEDVYYEADFDGNPIYMLAFLSPNLTPEELYRLNDITGENALKSVAAVEEVDDVYNLSETDFDDLKLYHLGPCRALPSYILTPEAWKKVLPTSFIQCREKALARAYEFESHAQEAVAAAGKLVGKGNLTASQKQKILDQTEDDGYVEFNQGQDDRSNMSDEDAYPSPAMSPTNKHANRNVPDDESQGYTFSESMADGHSRSPSRSRSASPFRSSSLSPRRNTVDESEPFAQENSEFPEQTGDPDITFHYDDDHPMDEPGFQRDMPSSNYQSFGEGSNENDDDYALSRSRDKSPMVSPSRDRSTRSYSKERSAALSAEYDKKSSMRSYSKERSVTLSPSRNQNTSTRSYSRDRSPTYSKNSSPSASPVRSTTRSNSVSPNRSVREEKAPPLSPMASRYARNLEVNTQLPKDVDMESDPSPHLDFLSPLSEASGKHATSPARTERQIPQSPYSFKSTASTYSKSSAMKGAQELLKKNREQRLRIMAKRRNTPGKNSEKSFTSTASDSENMEPSPTKQIVSKARGRSVTPVRKATSPPQRLSISPSRRMSPVKMALYKNPSSPRKIAGDVPPPPPLSPTNKLLQPRREPKSYQNDDDAKSVASSIVSAASSGWTDTTDPLERDSRRALILKMAKSRMRSKRDNISKS